ncbi:response regulator [Phormidium sp. CCY1219]|uniref:response regulator n=1 Tax=Phormidium sp. CCY1219 TaxID=2886104 RepID=UPI002D1F2872|nr:response regulator [Phormidium sp. CCY1219]MEB3828685.1 hybrid sensor histidine kinase/response regulator [Phormidium sp. CCY1219]
MNLEKNLANAGHILVVDDRPDNVRVLAGILTPEGYKVHKAVTGKMALTACETVPVDLILLDVMMPEMDGYETCQHLKNNPKTEQIPVIFISALNDVLDKVKAFEVGGVDYITKPFQDKEVLSRVETHLHLRRLQSSLEEKNNSLQREIQEREKIQSELELSEAKNQSLLRAIPDLMLRISAEGTLLDYRLAKNQPIARDISPEEKHADTPMHNAVIFPIADPLSKDSAIGKYVSDTLPSDLAIWVLYYVEQTLRASRVQIGEYMQQVNGKWHAYEVRFVTSGPHEVLAIARDISDRKQAEAARLQAQALIQTQKQELEQALTQLKQAQTQLVQNEKMVGLGQLASGIAHEINNPVSFIYGNITHVSAYFQDLLELIELFQQECPLTSTVEDSIQHIDLEFITSDIKNLLNSMKSGSERIQKIVLSLKNFVRLDESEMKSVDIHDGIENALTLLQHRLGQSHNHCAIHVKKDYGHLPKVTCYPSQLNQVFMHLLNNAIDALESSVTGHSSSVTASNDKGQMTNDQPQMTIHICTEVTPDNNAVQIAIADNGPGIPESRRSRLFDPFFTTKPVGSGTGLGLSISYQIVVQKHHGELTCSSTPGQGAKFTIEIPLNREKASQRGGD